MPIAAIEWGPVSTWIAAIATFLAAAVALLAAFGAFDILRSPRIRLTFENREPWAKTTLLDDGAEAFWVRIGVENVGKQPARGCVGKLMSVTTDGQTREDIDPVQLRWAGVPRSQGLSPIDIRRAQREYVNALMTLDRRRWRTSRLRTRISTLDSNPS
jgi:hypothetical protein